MTINNQLGHHQVELDGRVVKKMKLWKESIRYVNREEKFYWLQDLCVSASKRSHNIGCRGGK